MKAVKTNAICHCGENMVGVFSTDYDGEGGYFLRCEKCNTYFGLDEEQADMGYLQGYCNDLDILVTEWNRLVARK